MKGFIESMFENPIRWRKAGRILKPRLDFWWNQSYMSLPTAESIDDSRVRVYYGGRDNQNRSRVGFAEINLDRLDEPAQYNKEPALDLGELGTFDDNGVMPGSIVENGNEKLLYYVGWNPRATVRFSFFCGLAISKDGGSTFHRYSRAPILERTDSEPFVNASPFVLLDGETWRMYYVSGEGWIHPDLPRYNIKYAESKDGRNWHRTGHACIDFGAPGEHALARPCVIKDKNIYRMWFGHKGADFDLGHHYRMGYAESEDAIHWERRDSEAGIEVSASGWDSEMIEYAYVFEHKGTKYMLYNGNDYGRAGVGLAIAE